MASALVSMGQVHSSRLSITGFSLSSRLVDSKELIKSDLGVREENKDRDCGLC